ncbi:MAG: hypothetical protein NTY22_04770, partial [Proteobacteria bacterium]|nr:hypothetical protein [Pseudomonadota bacterium]
MDLKPSVLNYLSYLNSRGIKYVPNIKSNKNANDVGKDTSKIKDNSSSSPNGDNLFGGDTKLSKPVEMKKARNIYTDCKYEDLKSLEEINSCIGDCKRCRLSEARTK